MLHWVGGVAFPTSTSPLTGKWGPVKIRDVVDGTSNTLAVGEYTNLGNIAIRTPGTTRGEIYTGTQWANGYDWYCTGDAGSQPGAGSRGLIPNYERCMDFGQSNLCSNAFGSAHGGGIINFVRGDGSVINISPSIDIPVYSSMASIAGGEVVGDF